LGGSELLSDSGIGAAGRWLAAGVEGTAAQEVWHRTAHGGRPASAWPPRGPFDGIALSLPRTSAEIVMTLHALGARLAPGGRLLVAGRNDEGIRSAGRRLAELFAEVEDHGGRAHGRLYTARSPVAPLRGEMDDWAETIEIEIDGVTERFTSWPGLFAHGRLDAATALLLAHLPSLGPRVLDLGCGIGPVARLLAKRGHEVDAIDVDALAVEATRRNVPSATVHLADGVPRGRWDAIVTNPPLHRGGARDPEWVPRLLARAADHLRRDGSLVLVTRATLPVREWARGGRVERLATDGKASVWSITSRGE
jgi:16S rRNA (guanine1207-N2)-methyltransferase